MATPPGPGRLRHWLAALRPKTLPAGAVPVVVGSAFAYADGAFALLPATAALLGALLIQVGTNLANDYHDHRRGADAPDRTGPPRATAMGWIAPRRVLAGALVAFALAGVFGLYLVYVAGWPILIVGLLSIASGYLYTGGPYPLGYHGWGDLFVFVFFGPVAVGGTYFVQTLRAPTPQVLLAGAALGLLAAAILVVNNLRDVTTDARAGKRTLAVLFGPTSARVEYAILLMLAFAVPVPLALTADAALLLPLASLPLAVLLVAGVARAHDAARLNRLLPRTAQLLALYGALLATGVVL